jgi:hypothetical protein
MQLSLPSIPSPAAAAPKASGAKNSPTSGASGDPADAAAESFDSFLPKNDSTDKPAKGVDDKSDADSEQTAAILTAGFWMPVVPTVVTTTAATTPSAETPATAPAGATGSAGTALTDGSTTDASLLATTNPRAFGAVIQPATQAKTPAQTASDPKTILPVVGDPTATTPSPATPNPATATTAPVVDAATSQMAAQAAAVSTGLPRQISGGAALPVKRGGVSSATISTGKSAEIETASSADPTKPTAIAADAIPTDKTAGQNQSDTGAKPAISADIDLTTAPKDATDQSASFGADVAKAAATLAGGVARKLTNSFQEKIAALADAAGQSSKNQFSGIEKYFLNTVQKGVASAGAALGTAVAKVNATMAAAPASARQKSDSTTESTTSFVFSADQAPTSTLTLDAPAPVATVRETMAAVISAVDALERRADVQQKSVDLQFHVGSEKLGLRVELRDGAVHTTFRTESSEMNSALAHEWHEVVQPALARTIHLAEPVFHSASTPGSAVPAASSDSASTAFGNGAQQQREQPKAPPTFASTLKREFYESAAPEAAPAIAPVSNSSQLLNALA